MERATTTKHQSGPMIIRFGFELICAVWIHIRNVEMSPSVQKFSPVLCKSGCFDRLAWRCSQMELHFFCKNCIVLQLSLLETAAVPQHIYYII